MIFQGGTVTLPETNSSPMKIPIFPGKYHQNGGFSSQLCMAMLVNFGGVTINQGWEKSGSKDPLDWMVSGDTKMSHSWNIHG